MTIDRESTIRVEAIKAEQDGLKKFKMYMEYLKDRYGNSGAADLLAMNFENLTDHDFGAYQQMIVFFKSISEQNCDSEIIKKQCNQIIRNSRTSPNKHFSAWMVNEMTTLLYLDILDASWDGDGDEKKSIQMMVKTCIDRTDPENLF